MDRVLIVTPAAERTTLGNRITAERWAGIIRDYGHSVTIATEMDDQDWDLLIALHARKSAASVERFHDRFPRRPLVVGLTGTDVYIDLKTSTRASRSIELATWLVALQGRALDELDESARAKARVIYQSAVAPASKTLPAPDVVQVCNLSHLREVKDPLRAAFAAGALPPSSRLSIVHIGKALDPDWEQAAREEERSNPRFRWLGELPHDTAMQILAGSRAMVLSSLAEGGSSAIAEAAVCGVPVLCSGISGNIGMMGDDYPGYFPPKDTEALTRLLSLIEADAGLRQELVRRVERLQRRFSPETERTSWRNLLASIQSSGLPHDPAQSLHDE